MLTSARDGRIIMGMDKMTYAPTAYDVVFNNVTVNDEGQLDGDQQAAITAAAEAGFSGIEIARAFRMVQDDFTCPRNLRPGRACACPDCN